MLLLVHKSFLICDLLRSSSYFGGVLQTNDQITNKACCCTKINKNKNKRKTFLNVDVYMTHGPLHFTLHCDVKGHFDQPWAGLKYP